jgi:hypothetical protein
VDPIDGRTFGVRIAPVQHSSVAGPRDVAAAPPDGSGSRSSAPTNLKLVESQDPRDEGRPIDEAGLPRGTTERLLRAGIRTLEDAAALREAELFRKGLWLGDVRKIVAALSRIGLSLRDGTLGGPPRQAREASPPRLNGRGPSVEESSLQLARNAALAAARARGDTLKEAGAPFGLSRERVRQILAELDAPDADAARRARAERQAAAAELRRDELLAAWRLGSPPKEIAAEIGLSRKSVIDLIARRATTADRAERRRALFNSARCARPVGYSDEHLVEALRAVIQDTGEVPASKDYRAIARAEGLPSLSTVENRFGGWNAAVRAAGHAPRRVDQRRYQRRWTERACLDALRALVAELGHVPCHDDYRRLSRVRSDLPSASTVRTRLGRWSTIALRIDSHEPPKAVPARRALRAAAQSTRSNTNARATSGRRLRMP